MRPFERIKKKIGDYLFDSSIYVKDRTFVLFTVCELAALLLNSIIGFILGEVFSSVFVSLVGVVAGLLIIYIFAKKGRMETAKIVLTLVLVLVLRPLSYFSKGGIDNGTLIMFLIGGYYLVLVLDGKFRIFMCILDTVILIICGSVAYYHPELLPAYSRENDFIYSYVQYIIAFVVLTILITFWTAILKKETQKADEKSRELEELNRSQSRFFSSMSHEIRTPINTVLGLNEIILRQEDASEEIKKDARSIQGAGKMLLALINDILDISKIEAGKMDIVPVNYNVSSLLSEIVDMIWLKADEKGLKFNVDIDPDVPEILFGDEVRIKQILINLLNNAVKYTKEGSVGLHMECEFPEGRNALLRVVVSDTGMGIKPEALPHLFDTFQRVDEEKNRYIEGTGLGLSIVKQLVEIMDGRITVNSVYGQGSSFTVEVKQGISSDKRIGDISVTNTGSITGSEKFRHRFRAPSARILIVDDNEMNLQVEQKLIEGTKMTVDLALSGEEALTKTLQNRYDVIFMDHLMPEMDGIECYEKIRLQKGGLNTSVPVIALTANAGGENIELYNNTGFDGYLVKPVSGRQLEDMLMAHLPGEKVIAIGESGMTVSAMSTASGYARKKPVIIATSSMSDLPADVLKELQIEIVPYKVTTEDRVFFDNIDIDSDELVRYMGDELKPTLSEPPSEDELVSFFAVGLQRAHHLIYITLTTGSSREYGWAVNAAKSFDNVTIINSENMSSATGILVLIAARLASQNLPVEKIISGLEEAKTKISCSFVIRNTEVMARRGRISPFMNGVLGTLWLRPVLRVKNDKLGVGSFLFGDDRRCYEKYIKSAIPSGVTPDTSIAFITYAGMEEEDLIWIEEKLKEKISFEKIIFQKASAGITSNCGPGTFGIIYMVRSDHNYNLGAFFADEKADYLEPYEDDGPDEPDAADELHEQENDKPASKEVKWYENIPELDVEAAVKNSGSEEAFLSVLKIYYDSFETRSGEIQEFYDQKDWENYTIKVHALKSSSRLVGAMKLGTDAEALEMAGKQGDIDYITGHHDKMMDGYRAIRNKLDAGFGRQREGLPEIPPEILADAYGGIAEFADNMDYELVKMVMDSVMEYRLPPDDEERFDRIQKKLSQMDWDGIKETVHEVI
ncbi:MAG: DegV family EDD domain-containing protein [Lachnospiraceae bacterium]|nr:DegV family EDD domain-containing protein [Lachnospiraceae bacterium]